MTWNLPNLLSILRLGLIPLFVFALMEGRPVRALAVFAAAALTDALDGLAARFLGQSSILGRYLDPIADKLLLISAYVMLAVPGLSPGIAVPPWVTVLVILRDVLILIMAAVLHLTLGVAEFSPTGLSKVNTAIQVLTVVLVLLTGVTEGLDLLAAAAIYVVAATTLFSGVDYLYRLNRLLEREHEPT